MRIAFWDLETSALNGSFGQLLCGAIGEHNHKGKFVGTPFLLQNYKDERWNDLQLALDVRAALEGYDVVVTYNGKRFDHPFINTRLYDYGERGVVLKRHVDLYWTARNRFRLHSNSLDNFARFLGVPTQKTKLDPRVWRRAICGEEASYWYIVEHCLADIKVLAEVWDRVRDLVTIR